MPGIGTKVEQGWVGSGTSAAALASNTCVTWDVNGLLANTGVGGRPIGTIQEGCLITVVVAFTRKIGGAWVSTTGAVAVGDLLKCGAAGVLVVEAIATTATAFTVAVVREINTANNLAFVEWC